MSNVITRPMRQRLAPVRAGLAGWLLRESDLKRHDIVLERVVKVEAELKEIRRRVGKGDMDGTKKRDALVERMTRIESELQGIRKRVGKPKAPKRIQDKRFLLLAATIAEHGRTLLQQDRLWILWQAARNTAPLGLPAAEIGSYRGGSAYFLAASFLDAIGHELPLHVIDTFEGHPEEKLTEADSPVHKPGSFSHTSYAEVAGYLSEFEQVHVHKGEFSAVAPGLSEAAYGFVHIDVDLYEPALDCLRYFGPKLPAGGVIVLDDYEAAKCPGIKRAVEEYLAETASYQTWNAHTEQLILVKTA